MDRDPKQNNEENEEVLKKSIRDRIKKLFPSKEHLPAPMNVQQAESLKARVQELEFELSKTRPVHGAHPESRSSASPLPTQPLFRNPGRRDSLSRRILLPTLMIFLFSMAVFFTYNYFTIQADNRARTEENSQQSEDIFNSEIQRLSDFALGLAVNAANDPAIEAALAAHDREKLISLTLDSYLALNKEFNVPQYHYHLPPATSFLRLHNLEQHGDDMSFRPMLVEVNTTLKPAAGIEVGRTGLSLRGIEPIFYQGQHVGSVEYGLNIDKGLVNNLKSSFGNEWRILVTRETLSLATLEDISSFEAGPTPDLLLFASTVDPVYAPIASYESALKGDRALTDMRTDQGLTYSVTSLPLRDYSGNVIGVIDILSDQTALIQAQNTRLALAAVAALLVLFVGGLSLTTATNRSLRPLGALTRAAEAIERGDLNQHISVHAQDEIGQLAHTFNGMTRRLRELVSGLEQRVEERTHDLELAAHVGRTITENISDPQQMLTRAVEIIRARFNLYYVQIYLVDPSRHTITLRAGTGDVGKQLLLRGHRLAIGLGSLNGRAVAENHPVLVADTTQNPDFLPNPLLPNTRSEMVIPLLAGGQVIGTLNMQSTVAGALNEFNLPAFQALAGQLTIAIQNAQLFSDMEESRHQMEMNSQQAASQGWMEFLNAIDRSERLGYVYNQNVTVPLEEALEPLPSETLSIPISVAGVAIGEVQAANGEWTLSTREREILEATAAQLGQHLESLRLLAQADQYRRQAEQVTRRMTREGWEQYLQVRDSLANGYLYAQDRVMPIQEAQVEECDNAYRQPLIVHDETIGEVEVAEARALPEGDALELIEQVSASLGQHIEKLRLAEQTQEALSTTEKLYDASRAITSTQTEMDTAAELVRHIDHTGLDRVVLALKVANEPVTAEVVAVWDRDGMEARFMGNHFTDQQIPLVSQMNIDEAMLINDFDDAPHIDPITCRTFKFLGVKSAAIIPMSTSNELLGWLLLETTHAPVQFNAEMAQPFMTLAGHAANVIQGKRLLQQTLQSRAEIEVNEQRLSEALNIARLGHWEYDVEKDIFTFNDHFYSIFHTTAEKVGGYYLSSAQYAQNFVYPEDMPLVGGEIAKALTTTERYYRTELEHRIVFADGSMGHISVNVNVERDENGKIIRFYGANQDITERKQAQNTIAQRANQLETVAVVSSTASTVLDPDKLLQAVVDLTKERFNLYHAHIYLANESWNTLLLAVGAGDIGRAMVEEGHSIPMDTERSLVARAARGRLAVIVNDVRADAGFLPNPLLPDTRSEMAVPMVAGDRVLGVFDVQSTTVDDFTEEDANIYTTLAAQVAVALQNARLYVEQAATVTQLRELDRLKSSFLANMSHELRTPLNSILGFADVMLEGLDGDLTNTMENDLGLIQKNGRHLLHLINDVLDMAKIEAGKMNLSLERFSLQEILEEVTSITQPMALEKALAMYIEPDSDHALYITADHTRIRQVMINVVNNAIKFTEKGHISIRYERHEDKTLTIVRDTGIGIHTDKLEAVFQEFTQVDSSSTRKTGGTGLGLPISRRLVEMHGGRMWAESTGNNGEGSTFFVELPIEAQPTEPAEKTEK